MGVRSQSPTMKLNVLLISAAMAQELQCYNCVECPDVSDDTELTSCSSEQGHCYTYEVYHSEKNETYYERGCYDGTVGEGSGPEFEEGCIEINIDDKAASACYKSCIEDKCNTHTDLNTLPEAPSPASTATSSIFAAILCYMML